MSKSSTLERLLSQPELQSSVNNCSYGSSSSPNSSRSMALDHQFPHPSSISFANITPSNEATNYSRDHLAYSLVGQNGQYQPTSSTSSMLALCDWSLLSSITDSEHTITAPSSSSNATISQAPRPLKNSNSSTMGNMNITLTDILNNSYSMESDFKSNNGGTVVQNPQTLNNNKSHPKESVEWCITDVQVKHIRFTWTIDNFSLCIGSPGETLHSDVFSSTPNDKTAWCLQVAPNAKSHDMKHLIALHLINVRSDMLRVPVRFRCSLLSPSTGEPICSSDTGKFHLIRPWMNVGFSKFFERELTKSTKSNKSLDRITFYAEVYYVGRVENQIGRSSTRHPAHKMTLQKPPEDVSLADDLEVLLDQKSLSDIEIKTQGTSYSAHKAILAAGSPVYLELFTSSPTITQLNMDEFEPEAVQQFLIFLYSRKRLKAIRNVVKDVLKAAIKYQVTDLITHCEVELSYQINVLNCFEFLAFAHSLSSSYLKNHSLEFIISHSSSVINTRGFKIFSQNYPNLLSETFLALAARNNAVKRSQDKSTGEFYLHIDRKEHPLSKKRKFYDQSINSSDSNRHWKASTDEECQ